MIFDKVKKNLLKGPEIHDTAYVVQGAVVVGDVSIGENSSIWFGSVVRGDLSGIQIGKYSNIQDNCTLHVANEYGVVISDYVSVGHNVIVHGARIDEKCLIGMGAILMNQVHVKSGCIIAAGALLKENTITEERSLYAGVPAKFIRKVTDEEFEANYQLALKYAGVAAIYKENTKL